MAEEKTLEKLDFNKLEAKDGKLTIEHIHQELETPKVYYDKSVELNGTISAPGNFVEKRTKGNHLKDGGHEYITKDQYPRDRANIQFSYQQAYIKLRLEENKEVNYHIVGKLIVNPEIAAMGINAKNRFTVPDLTQHIRMKRYFFSDVDQHKRLMEHLQMFKVEAQKTIEVQNDNRGNAKDLYEIKNQSNLDLTFDTLISLYVGQPKKKFKVEVCYTVRERSVEVWLESPELEEALKAEAQIIIDKELERFPIEYVKIEQ